MQVYELKCGCGVSCEFHAEYMDEESIANWKCKYCEAEELLKNDPRPKTDN